MAKTTTNDAKRAEMATIMGRLFDNGWTAKYLSLVMEVTPSCISAWKNGKSMGTNSQRAYLKSLPAFERATDFIREAIDTRQTRVSLAISALEKAKSQDYFDSILKVLRDDRLYSIRYHGDSLTKIEARKVAAESPNAESWDKAWLTDTKGFTPPMTNHQWEVKYHAEALEEAQNTTEDDLLADAAKRQEQDIERRKKELADAEKEAKAARKLI
jgi:uncharacterized protein (DUF305 family)